MFSPVFKDFNKIKQGSHNKLDIDYSGVKAITRLTTPCGCISARVDIPNSKIVIVYTPKDVPKHLILAGKNSYEPLLTLNVEYDDVDGTSSKQDITITAKVTT